MTKEELEKEAEEYFKSICGDYNEEYERTGKRHYWVGFDIKNAYLAGAEPREKRIEELEETKANLEYLLEGRDNEIDELKKENKVLAQNLEDTEICENGWKNRVKDLEKENAELRKVAEFQQSSNMSRHFENKKLKEGFAVGSTFNKALNSMNKNLEEERDKYRNMVFDKDNQLTKAKEIIKGLLSFVDSLGNYSGGIFAKAEQFLKE